VLLGVVWELPEARGEREQLRDTVSLREPLLLGVSLLLAVARIELLRVGETEVHWLRLAEKLEVTQALAEALGVMEEDVDWKLLRLPLVLTVPQLVLVLLADKPPERELLRVELVQPDTLELAHELRLCCPEPVAVPLASTD